MPKYTYTHIGRTVSGQYILYTNHQKKYFSTPLALALHCTRERITPRDPGGHIAEIIWEAARQAVVV